MLPEIRGPGLFLFTARQPSCAAAVSEQRSSDTAAGLAADTPSLPGQCSDHVSVAASSNPHKSMHGSYQTRGQDSQIQALVANAVAVCCSVPDRCLIQ